MRHNPVLRWGCPFPTPRIYFSIMADYHRIDDTMAEVPEDGLQNDAGRMHGSERRRNFGIIAVVLGMFGYGVNHHFYTQCVIDTFIPWFLACAQQITTMFTKQIMMVIEPDFFWSKHISLSLVQEV